VSAAARSLIFDGKRSGHVVWELDEQGRLAICAVPADQHSYPVRPNGTLYVPWQLRGESSAFSIRLAPDAAEPRRLILTARYDSKSVCGVHDLGFGVRTISPDGRAPVRSR
jgi:hypothetical protein